MIFEINGNVIDSTQISNITPVIMTDRGNWGFDIYLKSNVVIKVAYTEEKVARKVKNEVIAKWCGFKEIPKITI